MNNLENAAHQWVSFQLADERYALPALQVREVIRPPVITPVPGAKPDVLGVINLRGTVVPILDGRARLGLGVVPAGEDVRFVLVEIAGQVAGIRVDAVAQVLDIDPAEIGPHPSQGAQEHQPIQGVVRRQDEGLLILLDPVTLFYAHQWHRA